MCEAIVIADFCFRGDRELHLMDMVLFEEDFGYECLILLGSNYLIPTPPTEMTVNDEVWKKM